MIYKPLTKLFMIQIYNRNTKSYEEELIAGKKYIKWTYESPIGKSITELITKKKLFSKVYGMYCDTKLSANKIPSFVDNFSIDMDISQKNIHEFTSFNDFFTRELIPGARPINQDKSILSQGMSGFSANLIRRLPLASENL